MKLDLPYMTSTAGDGLVLTSVPPDAAVAVADLAAGKFVFASRTPAADVLGGMVVNENGDGSLALFPLGTKNNKGGLHASLSLGPLPSAWAISLAYWSVSCSLRPRTCGCLGRRQAGHDDACLPLPLVDL